jgi:hypothetical protein
MIDGHVNGRTGKSGYADDADAPPIAADQTSGCSCPGLSRRNFAMTTIPLIFPAAIGGASA